MSFIIILSFKVGTLSYYLEPDQGEQGSYGSPKVTYKTIKKDRKYLYECEFRFPCEYRPFCMPYKLTFEPNTYMFEAYGPSGNSVMPIGLPRDPNKNGECLYSELVSEARGNVKCEKDYLGHSTAGAGGYSKGTFTINHTATGYLLIGGWGEVGSGGCETKESCENDGRRPKGGFNGGGRSLDHRNSTAGSGATDLRMDQNTIFHRIIVAGGGGNHDSPGLNDGMTNPFGKDDGSGGAGGGAEAQGYWTNGVYNSGQRATQTGGYSFGRGGAAWGTLDIPAGSGGWYGGFPGSTYESGSGGGSGFVLSKDAIIPTGYIQAKGDTGGNLEYGQYAFTKTSEYVMYNVSMVTGMWQGTGMMRITFPILSTSFFTFYSRIYDNLLYILAFVTSLAFCLFIW